MADIFSSTQPLLIPRYTDGDQRFNKYDFSFLRQHCSDLEVTATQFSTGDEKKLSIGEYLDHMNQPATDEPFYIQDWQYWRHEDIFQEIDPLEVTENWLDHLPASFCPKLSWMFIGGEGTHSSLHVDLLNTSAWNVLLQGEKRWFFFPPDFEFPFDDLGKIDVRTEACRFHPQVIELVQRKGDMVYTPPQWYHQVFNETNSYAITENFLNAANYEAVYSYFAARNESRWLLLLSELKAALSE